MAWLAKLDARARSWPMPIRVAYLGAKWYLILGGAFILAGLVGERIGLWAIF